jgi:hypothetical protein
MTKPSSQQTEWSTSGAFKEEASLQISCLGVITCGRMEQLRRCLSSYVSQLQQHGRTFEVAVMDDSGSAEDRKACRKWLRSLGQKFQIKVFYAGEEEKAAYVTRMAMEGVPSETMRFLLTNPLGIPGSPGANRNALLLHTATEAVLSCDDDSVCFLADFREGPQAPKAVSAGNSQLDCHFVSSNREAVDSVSPAACDVFSAHEQLLGKSLLFGLPPASASGNPEAHAIRNADASSVGDRAGAVRITVSGVLGDSGMPHCAGFMFSKGDIRERFLRQWDAENFLEAGRHIIRGVCRPVVAPHAGVMMTTATGLDNRVALPPFLPSGRGEDTFFGVAARKCIADLLVGFIPFALLHAPRQQRTYEPLGGAFRISDLAMVVLAACPDRPGASVEEGLRSLGEYLLEYTRVDYSEFRSRLLGPVKKSIAAMIDACKSCLLEFHSSPWKWAREMRRWIEQLESRMKKVDAGILEGLLVAFSSDLAVQRFLHGYGDALQQWIEIVATSRRLRAKECRLGALLNGK